MMFLHFLSLEALDDLIKISWQVFDATQPDKIKDLVF